MTERLTSETEAGVNNAKGQEAEGDGKKRGMTRVHRWRARGAQRRWHVLDGRSGPEGCVCAHGPRRVPRGWSRGAGRGAGATPQSLQCQPETPRRRRPAAV